MKFLAIIPSRFSSSRLPGKPLVDIGGKSMVQRVYEQAKLVFEHVIVATDDDRIFDEVIKIGGQCVMTSDLHQSGTDRCAEALDAYEKEMNTYFDVVVNIQGDEPFIQAEQLNEIKSCFNSRETQLATLIKKIETHKDVFNPNKPKVVTKQNGDAIYFSRSPVPYVRGENKENWAELYTFYKHIGMYGYRSDVLRAITKLKQSSLEVAEQLEQNRWIENGYSIKTYITTFESDSVDTEEDLLYVKEKYI